MHKAQWFTKNFWALRQGIDAELVKEFEEPCWFTIFLNIDGFALGKSYFNLGP